MFFASASYSLLSTATSGQTTFRLGVRGELNLALTTVDLASSASGINTYNRTADKDAIYAWQAGLVVEAALGKFALQLALLFSQNGKEFYTNFYYNGAAVRF